MSFISASCLWRNHFCMSHSSHFHPKSDSDVVISSDSGGCVSVGKIRPSPRSWLEITLQSGHALMISNSQSQMILKGSGDDIKEPVCFFLMHNEYESILKFSEWVCGAFGGSSWHLKLNLTCNDIIMRFNWRHVQSSVSAFFPNYCPLRRRRYSM